MGNKFFSYFRVSSKSQEREGVSLEVQKEANKKYADELGFFIVKEFCEVQTASKDGMRKQFYNMVEELRQKRDIAGIIFHDVDRSSRSWQDWAILDKLATDGYEIYFSKDKSGLNGRGQRLTADIKAAIAADFSRNLSAEVKKGMYKKIEQGYSMWGHAPTGYIPKGKGVRKVDPVMGSLVTQCFEFYATQKYSINDLCEIMNRKGLRSKFGNKMIPTKMCNLLGNKYYLGLINAKGKIYLGKHEPLVSKDLFDKVQEIKSGRGPVKLKQEEYKFIGILFCGLCSKRLRSTTAKGRYHYYYCRSKECPAKPIREELVEEWILAEMEKFKFTQEQVDEMVRKAKESKKSTALAMVQKKEAIQLQIDQVKSRLGKLVERELDGEIPAEVYSKKRDELTNNLKNLENELTRTYNSDHIDIDHVVELSKLLADPVYAYQNADWEHKRKLVSSLMKDIKVMPAELEYNSYLNTNL